MSARMVTPAPMLRPRHPLASASASASDSSSDSVTTSPLTEIFTPPQSCVGSSGFTLSGSSSGVAGFSSAWRDYYIATSQCWPPSMYDVEYNWGIYSPGVCPTKYVIAQTSLITSNGAETTRAWCCPSDMTISGSSSSDGGNYQYCTSLASNVPVVSGTRTITTTSPFTAIQWPISVEWASSDLSLFTPASAPVLVATSSSITSLGSQDNATPTRARSSLQTATATNSSNSDTGLSTGAEAGIGAGVGIAVIAVIVGLILWMVKRRRNSGERIPTSPANVEPRYVDRKIELPGNDGGMRFAHHPIELNAAGGSPQEMDDFTQPIRGLRKSRTVNSHPAELGGD